MSTPATIKTALQAAIRKANNATGAGDTTVTDAVDSLIEGYGKGGIEPQGSITIVKNGTYDVTEKAEAVVNVPASGITPSGTKEITENGTFDISSFASVLVNVPVGLNAKSFTATVSADSTSTVNFLTNDWLKSIRSNSNAFVLVRYLGVAASTACVAFVFTANFPIAYGGTGMYNSIVIRSSTSAASYNGNSSGLNLKNGVQYNGHLNIDTNGRLYAYGNTSFPIKAGQYQIVAGILEML